MLQSVVISRMADLEALLADLPPADQAAMAAWDARDPQLTKPPGALGRLEELSRWLCAWQGRALPAVERPHVAVFAGNHGIAAQGVSAFPPEVTVQMVANFQAGGAAVNQLALAAGATFSVTALELDRPTADFTKAPAMSEAELVAAMRAGMDAIPQGCDLLAIGEMGIGNTTSAAAIAAALFGGSGADWVGRGTGVDDAGLSRKRAVVDAGLAAHQPASPLDALRIFGGRELAAMAGAVLGARLRRIPLLLDGFITTAAAAALFAAEKTALDHCRVAHCSAEPGHRRLVERLGQVPLFDLGMRLGEASGAALAIPVVRAAAFCHSGMATFGEAGVAEKE